ncbi:2,3-diketo-5-methylthio-1-phosphopentane phosphatase [Lecanosticta acicola]|uniref:2,3-diketo-5-methylthio-1-phosphopentane phosphatase n=1 Tax=Lecanosticta acicola TaxID=111012 RepID=A0AAI8Z275_9PEZI|nr:2,3-diketo-5-methylthio-1-phosphopentane phosphatase [Lecanosticta acicola]
MEGIKLVLLDIEGTVCPISFVKETLFPYAIKALPDCLARKWEDADFQPYRDAFPEEYRHDPDALQAHVEDLTKRDVKIAYLKNLQGYLWEDGYKTGAYSTTLFSDVVPALRQWKDDGYALAIYSSGSVFAQKLLFGHVSQQATDAASRKRGRPDDEAEDQATDGAAPPPPSKKVVTEDGETAAVDPEASNGNDHDVNFSAEEAPTSNDAAHEAPEPTSEASATPTSGGHDDDEAGNQAADLTGLFQDWFDTTNAGLKTESDSYTTIAAALKLEPQEILFLSDNVKEVKAALDAKMHAILVDRPGNAPLSEQDKKAYEVVDSLDKIKLTK